ncbi:MAG: antibiotic biosynthesis monooxygenase [Acidimicrobiia bacterium]
MALMVVLHRVDDYGAWRKVYDEVAPLQKSAGVLEESVYRMTDDPDHVLVLHRFATADEAEAFLASDELRAAMGRAGVQPDSLRAELFEEA